MPKRQGFTLIELLVVISIIGLLATLLSANLTSARSRARDSQRKSDLKNISTALRLYYNDVGNYPAAITFGSAFQNGTTVYMEKVPNDPLGTPSYVYQRIDLDTFKLLACLENASDSQGKTASGITCSSSLMFQVSQ